MATAYIIYADESVDRGRYYSNFYGGALVRSRDIEIVSKELNDIKIEQNLFGEVKWVKVTKHYLEKYSSNTCAKTV